MSVKYTLHIAYTQPNLGNLHLHQIDLDLASFCRLLSVVYSAVYRREE